jgi:hypothetical protein
MLVAYIVNMPQTRHPERSASQTYRVTPCLVRGVEEPVPSVAEGTPRALIPPALLGVFQPPKLHRADPPRSFPYNGDSLNYLMADNGTAGIHGKMVFRKTSSQWEGK